MAKPTLLTKIRKELSEYPPGYDAHKDSFSDGWERCESVNKLLQLLIESERELANQPRKGKRA